MPGKVPKTRVQIDITAREVARLEVLKESLEQTSYAGVVRKSLIVLGIVNEEQTAGNRFFVERTDGSRTELVFML